jgi:hypothetical protein
MQSVYCSVHSVILQRKACSLFTAVFIPWYCKGNPAVCLLQSSLRDIADEVLQSVYYSIHSMILQRKPCCLLTAVFTPWYFKGSPAVCLLQSPLRDIAKEALQSVYCSLHSVIFQRKPCSLFTAVFTPWYCKGNPSLSLLQFSAFSITWYCVLTVRKTKRQVFQMTLCIISEKLKSMPVGAAYQISSLIVVYCSSLIKFHWTA